MPAAEITVSNTGPIIALANIDCFDLLKGLFQTIWVADAVYREATRLERLPAARLISKSAWVKRVSVKDRLAVDLLRNELDEGESETIVLGRELNAAQILIDERLARRKTTQLEFKTIGTLGILLLAKSSGLIPSVRIYLDRLQSTPFRMSPSLYADILRRANES
jgi:predicted nucleic acid-binding protein